MIRRAVCVTCLSSAVESEPRLTPHTTKSGQRAKAQWPVCESETHSSTPGIDTRFASRRADPLAPRAGRCKFITRSLFEQRVVDIRPVDLRVAQRAGLILRGLVMEGRRAGRIGKGRGMARQAQQVHVADLQQMSVGRAVRRVAGLAAFHLHRLMLEYERAALIGVAREANGVLRRGGSHLLRRDRAVRVVAVAALNQPLVHAMMKGHARIAAFAEDGRSSKAPAGP